MGRRIGIGIGRQFGACVVIAAAATFLGNPASGAQSNASSASQLVTITIPAPVGEIPQKWLNYPGPPKADVLLPAGYTPSKKYPLLVLLNGLGGNYEFFAEYGLTAAFNGFDGIVVMPEGGSGWYTDWWNGGTRSGPSWETYELDTVIPTILAKYPILPQRQYHAIAGVSMGGLGATFLGGRLPGFFGSVATLSGFVNLNWLEPILEGGMGYESSALTNGDYNFPYPVDGPPGAAYFAGHNPESLAMNLQQTRVYETTGTFVPSTADLALLENPETVEEFADGEWEEGLVIYEMNQQYHQTLTDAGVNVTYQVHSGGHDVPEFMNELKAMLAWGLFKPVVDNPNSWTNDTVATSGYLWDISYDFAQPPTQVVQFKQSGSSLSISAAGSDVTVATSVGCVIHTTTPATIQLPSSRCP